MNETILSSKQVIQQQHKTINNLNLLVQCLNNVDQLNFPGQCYMMDFQDGSCSQKIYLTSFDITAVTNTVNMDGFDRGYVFNSTTEIQNAFIDVSDYIYSTTQPLFQTQSTFTNLKIQFGTQTLKDSGSFIVTSASITINQMSIISRRKCDITLNSAALLNIITVQPTNTIIANLLVNLCFQHSNGNITLFNSINGIFNISGYQVLGTYDSTCTVAMIGLNVKTAAVYVNQVSFKPCTYNVGNSSSYLFGNAITPNNTITINNFAVLIGNKTNYLLLNSILSDDNINYYQFGGIFAFIGSTSININYIIFDSYQQFSSGNISQSGFLVGHITSSVILQIHNICFQQNIISTTQEFYNFGLIGGDTGIISIQNATITVNVQSINLYRFGIIGIHRFLSAQVVNLIVYMNISSLPGSNRVSSIIGYLGSTYCLIQNANVKGNIIGSGLESGGFIGYLQDAISNVTIENSQISQMNFSGQSAVGGFIGSQKSNTTILDSLILQSNISGSGYVGGFVGFSNSSIYLTNSAIRFVRISGSSSVGIVVGFNDGGSQTIISSSSIQIYLKNILQNDCPVLSSTWSVTQCT
ncbi:Hypothetical_protein [Hexamita inflata]|uniref:Hypothetical_protein n=1 Tax=Hexamita inflata TaxID=28002 RepID=A0ABP1K163_9EUKA